MGIVSIRGAITVAKNSKEDILEATRELLMAIIEANQIERQNIIQIHFSATKDLDAAYPAVAARAIGLTGTSLMCFQEMYVVGSLEQCIRASVLVNQEGLERIGVKHQYLKGAAVLRPDLANKENKDE